MNIIEITDKIIEDGVITREEYAQFMSKIDEDGVTDEIEEEQIKRVLKMIQNGKLKVIQPQITSK
jgi:anti-sigma28 factor (negative regulator of flagellin synthesis)